MLGATLNCWLVVLPSLTIALTFLTASGWPQRGQTAGWKSIRPSLLL
jgi:hypothetical protein